MDINKLTIAEVREIAALLNPAQKISECAAELKSVDDNPYHVGANYFIRTVTHHHTGRLVRVTNQELVLEDAAWIADDGCFTEALATCEFSEVEMFPAGRQVIVGRGSVVDATEITNIPTSKK